jgi:hypothetical protein
MMIVWFLKLNMRSGINNQKKINDSSIESLLSKTNRNLNEKKLVGIISYLKVD